MHSSSILLSSNELWRLQEGRSFRLACKFDQMVRLATYSEPGLNESLCFTSVTSGAQDEWVIKDFVDDAFTLGPAKSYFN